MRALKTSSSLRRKDGTLKTVSTAACTPRNFRKTYMNQLIPLLRLYANKSTEIVLYLLNNMDSSNMIYTTYAEIQENCGLHDGTQIAKVLRELQEAEAIVKVSQSHYMVNPALMMQGDAQKYGLLASTFNELLERNRRKGNKPKENQSKSKSKEKKHESV